MKHAIAEFKEFMEFVFGKNSDINLLGKISLGPLLLFIAVFMFVINVLFIKRK